MNFYPEVVEYAGGFRPGDQCLNNGSLPAKDGEVMTVVAWEPHKWIGLQGSTRFRPGLVPVFIPSFPETVFWWAAPEQLKKLPAQEAPKSQP